MLESKIGNWEYLTERWTQIPRDNETGPNVASQIEVANRTVLGVIGGNYTVDLQNKSNSTDNQMWLKSKTMDGFFTLQEEISKLFLTVENSVTLVIRSKYFNLLIYCT